jgi:hypothetical protein
VRAIAEQIRRVLLVAPGVLENRGAYLAKSLADIGSLLAAVYDRLMEEQAVCAGPRSRRRLRLWRVPAQ